MFDNGFGRIYLADTEEDWTGVYGAWVERVVKAEYREKVLALSEEDQRQLVRSWEWKRIVGYLESGLADGSLEKVAGGKAR